GPDTDPGLAADDACGLVTGRESRVGNCGCWGARVTGVAAWVPVFPSVPGGSGTKRVSTTMAARVSSKYPITWTVRMAPIPRTSNQVIRDLTSCITEVDR